MTIPAWLCFPKFKNRKSVLYGPSKVDYTWASDSEAPRWHGRSPGSRGIWPLALRYARAGVAPPSRWWSFVASLVQLAISYLTISKINNILSNNLVGVHGICCYLMPYVCLYLSAMSKHVEFLIQSMVFIVDLAFWNSVVSCCNSKRMCSRGLSKFNTSILYATNKSWHAHQKLHIDELVYQFQKYSSKHLLSHNVRKPIIATPMSLSEY